MKSIYFLISFLFFTMTGFSQTSKQCKQLLNKKFSVENINQHKTHFLKDFKTLIDCNFETIDYEIFLGPNTEFDFFLNLGIIYKQQTEREITFKDLKDILEDLKKEEYYNQARKVVEAKNKIINRKANVKNWKKDKELLQEMNFTEKQIQDLYQLVKENHNSTYAELFQLYSNQLLKEEIKSDKKVQSNNKTTAKEWFDDLYAYQDYEFALEKSQKLKQPLLIYFTSYSSVEARRMENIILLDEEIKSYINQHFTLTILSVNGLENLEENKTYYSSVLDKKVKTISDKNLELQLKRFNSKEQPFFVIINSKNEEVSKIGFTINKEEFLSFLKKH